MIALNDIDPGGDTVRTLVLLLDLGGTFAFGLVGAMAAVRRNLDIYGVLVVAFVAATFGGIGRDLLIGAVPPAALIDWRYLAVSLLAGAIAFIWHRGIVRLHGCLLLFDAAGLAFFCIAGAEKALAFGLSPVTAALLGMLTGVGGGMARDIFLAEIPAVLRSELYAVAALAGSAIVVGGEMLHLPSVSAAVLGGLLCFGLRVAAIRRGWRLPGSGNQAPAPHEP